MNKSISPCQGRTILFPLPNMSVYQSKWMFPLHNSTEVLCLVPHCTGKHCVPTFLSTPQQPMGFICENCVIRISISNFQQKQISQFHALLLQISSFGFKTENIFWLITTSLSLRLKSSARHNNLPHCSFS